MSRLKEKYEKEIAPKLAKELGIENVNDVPKVTKIVVNSGIGEIAKDKGAIEDYAKELSVILGQRPAIRQAKVSEAGFNLRAGMPVGLKVTLRGKRMYEFLDRLISITLPRLRDFRGLSLKSFDKGGNYTIGISDHTVFPELDLGKVGKPRGFEITIVTKSRNPKESKRLLELMGMPFEKHENTK
ncbi:50S ribosomal protein L5 [Patescibacteria group bacterium]|nr:50S ribosomal protein L5 [Patescibacteria group bacterium]